MRFERPQQLGLTHRVVEAEGKYLCTFGLPMLFSFDSPGRILPDVELWKFLGEQLDPDALFDVGVPKHGAEYVVIGQAFAPTSVACEGCHVRARVGGLEKLLLVYGDRRWTDGAPGRPTPFQRMPLRWSHAFGGTGHADNPVGKGHAARDQSELPNIEDPSQPLRRASDTLQPACFAPLDATWPMRASKAGTYDAAWLESRFPGMPRDFRWSFFNVAPADQWQADAFRGDEALRFENLHPTQPLLTGQLPGVRGRCFIKRHVRHGTAASLEEVPLALDTLWLFPAQARGVLVFHGMLETQEDDASDVALVLLACEALGNPKPFSHYEAVLARRTDPEYGLIHSLCDADLMPDASVEAPLPQPPAGSAAIEARMQRRAARDRDRARALCVAQGLDPDRYVPSWTSEQEPLPTLDRLPELLRRLRAESETQTKRAREQQQQLPGLREVHQTAGVAHESSSMTAPSGPPTFSARAQNEQLDALVDESRKRGMDASWLEQYAADPARREQLSSAEQAMRDGYRLMAHRATPAASATTARSLQLRAQVIEAHRNGLSMQGWDLTGVDLSALALRGAKLAAAWLESAKLVGTDLTDSDLDAAVLAHADLTRAVLRGASLKRANLGAACLAHAKLGPETTSDRGVDACGAIFADADLTHADLRAITLDGADLMNCKIAHADLAFASAREFNFLQCDLSHASFQGADLTRSNFVEVDLSGVDFSAARLSQVSFVNCQGAGVGFRRADLSRAIFAMGCRLQAADFEGADLSGANLRQQHLAGANFARAHIDNADFSASELMDGNFVGASGRQAQFVRARLAGATFVGANLHGANYQKALLHGASFARSNLFRADFGRARLDERSVFEGALLQQTKFRPLVRHE
jgi:uncharacterized protein YjbI with pentapeptide repeats